MHTPPLNVLFLCTGNSARSILAEAYLNARGEQRFRAYSAGSHPKGTVHPIALLTLENAGIDTAGLHSKSWDEFARAGAPELDLVITVCDNAANEACPLWPGRPIGAHWGVEDPAAVAGSEEERLAAFELAYRRLSQRIQRLIELPVERLDRATLEQKARDIANA
jgi:arsenate reductase (thioredoxin)